MSALQELIDRWNSDEGKPFKGKLIDRTAYEDGNLSLSCMCAQGQVLHVVGGWEPKRLFTASQVEADRVTARLLNISVAHAILLRNTNDRVDGAPAIVLTHPEKVLGDQAQKILALWLQLDGMTDAARAADRAAAWADAWDAAGAAVGDAARAAARAAAWDAVGDTARAAARATNEIQGAAIMRERGQPFYFLPLFGFATPEDIPALPDDYGVLGESK